MDLAATALGGDEGPPLCHSPVSEVALSTPPAPSASHQGQLTSTRSIHRGKNGVHDPSKHGTEGRVAFHGLDTPRVALPWNQPTRRQGLIFASCCSPCNWSQKTMDNECNMGKNARLTCTCPTWYRKCVRWDKESCIGEDVGKTRRASTGWL